MATGPMAAAIAAALLTIPLFLAVIPTAEGASAPLAWGSDLSQWLSVSTSYRSAAIATASATGMTVIGVDAKDGGPVAWATPSYTTFTSLAAGAGGVELVVQDAHAKGIKVVARFDVFEDSVAAQKFPGSAIAGGPWVDPACPDVRAYVLGELKDLVTRTAIDEVNFDHVRYPEPADASAGAVLPCTGGTLGSVSGTARIGYVTTWVRDAAAAARAIRPSILVSASTFAAASDGPLAYIGQDAAQLAPYLDIVRPMLYPTYFSAAEEAAPYATVHDYTARAVAKFGGAKVQPWVEAFGPYSTRADIIGQEFKAVSDAGGSGAIAWWFWSAGTSSTFWGTVASAIPAVAPAPAPAPSPAPAPAPTNVTFSGSTGTEWRDQVVVSGAAVSGVQTRDTDGVWTIMKLKSGKWSASFHIEPGHLVQYRATLTSGAIVDSCPYTHPAGVATCSASMTSSIVTTPPPPTTNTSTFQATFLNMRGNEWWVETDITTTGGTLAKVDASVNNGAWLPLAKTSWGSYAASIYAPAGSSVRFRATATDGQTVVSAAKIW